jgi:hypothetical protein
VREAWSQFEQAWRDTLIHKAEAAAFPPICDLYGVTYPVAEVPESGWAGVLKLNAYGSRGSFETVFGSTEVLLSHLNQKIPGSVSSSSPHVLVANGVWPADSVNRFIRKGSKLYFTKQLLTPSRLAVVSEESFYWDSPSEEAGTHSYIFELLPFTISERQPGRVADSAGTSESFTAGDGGCLFEVTVFAPPGVAVPKTWLQSPVDYTDPADVYTVEGVPYGGSTLGQESDLGNPSGTGPYPLYAYDRVIFPQTAKAISATMAASVEYRLIADT